MLSRLLLFLLLSIGFVSFSHAQTDPFCVPQRFGNQYIFTEAEVQIQSDIEFALSQNADGDWEPQLMDVYTPLPSLDTMTHRPLVVVLHGGGFKTGDKSDFLIVESLLALARSGYTAVSFNYRLGYDEPTGPCSADPDDVRRAVFRAAQDANAGMRFLFHHKDTYGIDTSLVYAGGISAGATLAAILHYGTTEYFDDNYPWLSLELGPLTTSGNGLDDEFSVDGLIMAWGSFPTGVQVTSDNAIPVIAFHGGMDTTVPIGDGTFGSCPNYPVTTGPDTYIPMIEAAGACYDYNRSPEGGHNVNIYGQYYIKNRTMCFIKSNMCSSCTSSTQEEGSPTCPELGLGINDLNNPLNGLSIFPNPNSGKEVCLRSESDVFGLIEIQILDIKGRVVAEIEQHDLFPQSETCLELDQVLDSGLYLVQIRSGASSNSLRFVID